MSVVDWRPRLLKQNKEICQPFVSISGERNLVLVLCNIFKSRRSEGAEPGYLHQVMIACSQLPFLSLHQQAPVSPDGEQNNNEPSYRYCNRYVPPESISFLTPEVVAPDNEKPNFT